MVRNCDFKRYKVLYPNFVFNLPCAFLGKCNNIKLAQLVILTLAGETSRLSQACINIHKHSSMHANTHTHRSTTNSCEWFSLSNLSVCGCCMVMSKIAVLIQFNHNFVAN